MVALAANKVQNDWVRVEAAKGEDSTQAVDDLQVVVKEFDLTGYNKPKYFESIDLPADYFTGKRVSAKGVTKECVVPRRFIIYDGEESNLDTLLHDENRCPDFDWAETFKTHIGKKIRIHTDGKFGITEAKLIYYRQPRQISFAGCVNEFDEPTSDVECEFKDDVAEIIAERTAAHLAGDIELFNQMQRLNTKQ